MSTGHALLLSSGTQRLIAGAAVLGAVASIILFGVLGVFRAGGFGHDLAILHEAGRQFLDGVDPWIASLGRYDKFAYPPHAIAPLMGYGALPLGVAQALHAAVNVVAIGVIVVLTSRLLFGREGLLDSPPVEVVCLAVVAGNPFVAHILFLGQTSLVVIAAAMAAWYFVGRGQTVAAGLCLAIATIKPQLSFLLVLWLLMDRRIVALAIGAGVSAAMMLPALAILGPVGTFESWFASMVDYRDAGVNQAGFRHVVGLHNFFASIGATLRIEVFAAGAIATLVVLYARRAAFSDGLRLQLVFALSLIFLFAHDYDYAATMPIVAYLVFLGWQRGSWPAVLAGLFLVALMCLPQRILRAGEFELLYQWRTPTLIAAMMLAMLWERRASRQTVPRQPSPTTEAGRGTVR